MQHLEWMQPAPSGAAARAIDTSIMCHGFDDWMPESSTAEVSNTQWFIELCWAIALALEPQNMKRLCVTVLLTLFALPTFAQSNSDQIPDNAHLKSYGDGWECDLSYRIKSGNCVAIVVPENAYATNRSYGVGWECLHGYKEVDQATCTEVIVPDGGFLDPSGQRWWCSRGYLKKNDTCAEVVVPANGYISDDSFGIGWLCNRGYAVEGNTCVTITVPDNAFLNGFSYGKPWTCERGYSENAGACELITVPENAYIDNSTNGAGWRCVRGYSKVGIGCVLIDLPANAHLDWTGNRWVCHRNSRLESGSCVVIE